MQSVNKDLGSKPIVQMTDEELISLLPPEMRETARKVISAINEFNEGVNNDKSC